ncbi:MAG TPA: glycosyl hydrolase [Solirubrobacterales bacterium]|nr:glycosyl hydrolase [Solirubrobacterales bacterium]
MGRTSKPLRKLFWVVLAGLAGILAIGVPTASAAIGIGVYSGAQGQSTSLESPAVLDAYIQKAGRAPSFVVDYRNVTDPLLSDEEVANLESHGTGVMITWQLFKHGWGGETISLPEIAAGRYDPSLRAAAQQAKALPFPVMIRFAHEMNGDWYPWGRNGSAGNVGTNYVDAWRHIVGVFRAEGATNVKWVWSPNVDYEGSYPFDQYFPGDDWVDYVALDGSNWGTSGEGADRWESLGQVFGSAYDRLTQLSSKPVIIAETSSSEAGGDKAAWIRKGFLEELPQRFPRVQDVVWFDRDQEQDWRIDSSQASLAAYREVVASTTYGGDVPPKPIEEGGQSKGKGKGKGQKKHARVQSLRVTRRVGYRRAVARRQRVQLGARVNGTIRYRLSDSSSVEVAVERRTAAGRYVREAVLERSGHAGRARLSLSHLRGKVSFRPGAYRVSVTAHEPGEGVVSSRRAAFRVVKRR